MLRRGGYCHVYPYSTMVVVGHPLSQQHQHYRHTAVVRRVSIHTDYYVKSTGGRPWGVQLLVIGQSVLSTTAATAAEPTGHHSSSLEMYILDPSGGWRSYCDSSSRIGGTAVGRGAERVRSCLR